MVACANDLSIIVECCAVTVDLYDAAVAIQDACCGIVDDRAGCVWASLNSLAAIDRCERSSIVERNIVIGDEDNRGAVDSACDTGGRRDCFPVCLAGNSDIVAVENNGLGDGWIDQCGGTHECYK